MSDRGEQLGYRPALDGMRAVAVSLVMLYHGGVSWAAGGFLGVDVFFVLSGFLITSLLVKEWTRSGRIALKRFWLRRARRLFPALLIVIAAAGAFFLVAQHQGRLRGDFLSTLAYVSNWWFLSTDQSYFAQFIEPSPLRHTWSLAIEEQFYILFPLLLVLLLGRARIAMPLLRGVFALGAAASAVLMAALHDPAADPSRVYYGTDTRVQALLVGAVLAVTPGLTRPSGAVHTRVGSRLMRIPGTRAMGWLGAAGLLAVIAYARELAPWMYRGGFFLTAILSAIVIAVVWGDPGSLLGRILASRPLVAVGIVSYGLYLWHWPVYVALNHDRTGLDGPLLLTLRVGVTALLAAASYRFVEEPIRSQRLQRHLTHTQWRRLVATSMTALLAGVFWASSGSTAASSTAAPQGARAFPVPDAQGNLVDVFLLGDSQTFALRQNFGNRIDGLSVNGSTQLGCGSLLPERVVDGQTVANLPDCAKWEARWTREVAVEQPDVVVLMLGQGELFDREVRGSVLTFATTAYRQWLFEEIDQRRELVGTNSRHFALATVLCMRISPDAASRTAGIVNDPERLAWLNATIREYADAHPDVAVVDLHATICSAGYADKDGAVTLRTDGLHLSEDGALVVWRRIAPELMAFGQ